MKKLSLVFAVAAIISCNTGSTETAIDKVEKVSSAVKDSTVEAVKPVVEKVGTIIKEKKPDVLMRKDTSR